MITWHLTTVPPPPSKFKAEIPAELDGIILKCLEKNRDKRWANTAQLRAALAPLLGDRSGPIALTPPPAQAAHWEDRSNTAKVDLPGDGGIAKNRLPLIL